MKSCEKNIFCFNIKDYRKGSTINYGNKSVCVNDCKTRLGSSSFLVQETKHKGQQLISTKMTIRIFVNRERKKKYQQTFFSNRLPDLINLIGRCWSGTDIKRTMSCQKRKQLMM